MLALPLDSIWLQDWEKMTDLLLRCAGHLGLIRYVASQWIILLPRCKRRLDWCFGWHVRNPMGCWFWRWDSGLMQCLQPANWEVIIFYELHKNDCNWFDIQVQFLCPGFGVDSNNVQQLSLHFLETIKISNLTPSILPCHVYLAGSSPSLSYCQFAFRILDVNLMSKATLLACYWPFDRPLVNSNQYQRGRAPTWMPGPVAPFVTLLR